MQTALMDDKANLLPGQDLPHLDGTGASLRQVIAAHFVRDCAHIIEIGGHIRPITDYITHHPRSVTSVDPKTAPYTANILHGYPCRVRHIPKKFQEVDFDCPPREYALVLLGFSLRPFGEKNPIGDILFDLIDKARIVVLEYPAALERALSQVPAILERPSLKLRTTVDLTLHDPEIAGTPYSDRRLYVLDPAEEF